MKHKQHQLKINRSLVLLSIVAIAVAILVAATLYRNHTTASSSQKPDTSTPKQPLFSFDATKAPGWRQGATNNTSMAVFDKDQVHACFVSAEYKKGVVNADVEIDKINTKLTQSGNGYVVAPIGSQTIELSINSTPQQYELRQSSVTTPEGVEKVKGGQEFGFVQLSNGYIKIMGYCDTPEQLSGTLASIQAIKFNDAK